MTEEPKNTGVIRNPDGTFPPGVSGNPKGKPPGSLSIVAKLKAKLQEVPDGMDKKTYLDLLVDRLIKSAIADGDRRSLRDILEYVEGMPKQSIDLGADQTVEGIKVEIKGRTDGTEPASD